MSQWTEEMKHTYSVCPVCLKRLPAERVWRKDGIYLEKCCPEHGSFSSVIWRNRIDFADWRGERPSVGAQENLNCHVCQGLCAEHLRDTCCTLLEVTERCNMNCTFCFADPDGGEDPSLETVKGWIEDLTVSGKTLLQLSGGEPTVREDLPEIVAYAKKAGCKYVQLNSNGLRLSEDEEYVKKLSEAGLSFVFLQFDGVTDAVYERLRRRPMLEIKKKAIEHCGKYGIGVTLVPVIVPGVNDDQIGEIIRFAIAHSPEVRGVHIQPVSYFGRIPDFPKNEDRFTLDELMAAVVEQTKGLIELENIAPSCCDHPMCGFHGDFIVLPGETLYPLTHYQGMKLNAGESGCCAEGAVCGRNPKAEEESDKVLLAEQNREFVGKRWERRKEDVFFSCTDDQNLRKKADMASEQREAEVWSAGASQCSDNGGVSAAVCPAEETTQDLLDMTDMETFLRRVRSHGFTITAMAFQDAGTLDIERLRQCSLHVYWKGKKLPFCARYLSGY